MSLKVYSGDTELIEIALNDKNFLTVYGILECRKHIMMIHREIREKKPIQKIFNGTDRV